MDIRNSLSEFQFIASNVKSFSLNNSFISFNESAPLEQKVFDLTYSDPVISDSDEFLLGSIKLTVNVQCKDSDDELNLSTTIEGAFSFPKDGDRNRFATMLTLNGCTTLFSIARSLIMSVTAQSFVSGQIVLPMINMISYQRDLKSYSDVKN